MLLVVLCEYNTHYYHLKTSQYEIIRPLPPGSISEFVECFRREQDLSYAGSGSTYTELGMITVDAGGCETACKNLYWCVAFTFANSMTCYGFSSLDLTSPQIVSNVTSGTHIDCAGG